MIQKRIFYPQCSRRLVKVGNFDLTIVANFRMASPDKETGKPRGYAFCEYFDIESAARAIKLLNGRDFNGRSLRVDFADNQSAGGGDKQDGREPINEDRDRPIQNRVTIDQMREIIAQIPKNQLYEAVASIKNMILQDPEQAKVILKQNPVLRFALIHGQYILGMEKQLWGQSMQTMQPMYKVPPKDIRSDIRSTPYQQQSYNYVQPSPQPSPAEQLLRTMNPQQLKELLALTPEQLLTLPEGTRQQVILIQQHAAQLTKQ
jgi:cleavage stimulation factor subunit 2